MSLGDLFPDNLKEDFAERNIDVGNALLIKLENLQVNYDKYVILVGVNEVELAVAYVIINTDINQNVYPTAYLQSLHLTIDVARHPFLEYDSHINCTELREFNKQELVDFIISNPERVVGSIDPVLLSDVKDAIKGATTITPILKRKYGFV
ncbi:hypothetical protein [Flavobacterium johnsoniae]|uniref:Uncharacterized protein n=1 Tax=Flavobacterium johnsoniae (strain ATCC 17061 / DSM 2064 / JCM 8514 / BCRC 14874 / CCUG 350202 / NBRC 14942 / NCIMB 11054 / UW101) TaxID=376686 RepID=A5FDT9_FLAJ1|nr:hypothetical protein [Flavobacterium johnsoniae]ABQ06628.1 hypothetical protein Fjoh_3614 [Flavobacterium johnsoniae UW101]OXE99865.1 hypothetical protein B0A63_11230 [Flavobacterium johnsoniae UW101]WQG82380.1 hypothetical protein SR927_04530 [Flavobacterium johnsoniae UW101]SHL99514.1 hypothetical protein SAMN05444146_5118 [Flavobacterium johnsoniae]